MDKQVSKVASATGAGSARCGHRRTPMATLVKVHTSSSACNASMVSGCSAERIEGSARARPWPTSTIRKKGVDDQMATCTRAAGVS